MIFECEFMCTFVKQNKKPKAMTTKKRKVWVAEHSFQPIRAIFSTKKEAVEFARRKLVLQSIFLVVKKEFI